MVGCVSLVVVFRDTSRETVGWKESRKTLKLQNANTELEVISCQLAEISSMRRDCCALEL